MDMQTVLLPLQPQLLLQLSQAQHEENGWTRKRKKPWWDCSFWIIVMSYVASSSSSVLEDGGLTHLPQLLTSFLLGAVF
jgi:hypothetical protein